MTTKTTTEVDRHITRCPQGGWHAHRAGPCFDTKEQACDYRDRLEAAGITWFPSGYDWGLMTSYGVAVKEGWAMQWGRRAS